MKTIERGPEQRIIGHGEGVKIAMPGQLRIPGDIAIGRHIAQFDSNKNNPELGQDRKRRQRAKAFEKSRRHELATAAGIPYKTIESYTAPQQALLWALHKVGNDESVRLIARDIHVTERQPVVENLMIKVAALDIYKEHHTLEHAGTGLDPQRLATVLRDVVRTNADWPENTDMWQNKLQKDLEALTHVRHNHWGTGAGVDTNVEYWEVQR